MPAPAPEPEGAPEGAPAPAPEAEAEAAPRSHRRPPLGRTRPTRGQEIFGGVGAVLLALIALIFYPDVMTLTPLPALVVWALLAVFHLAAFDVASSAFRGRYVRPASIAVVCIGGLVAITAVGVAAFPL